MAKLEITLKKGLNELKFGLTMDEVKKMMGNPDDTEIRKMALPCSLKCMA